MHILAREAEGQEQAEKTVERSGESHGDAVGSGKTDGGDGGTEGASEKDAGVRDEEKRRPENRGADGEMVVEVAGGRSIFGFGLIIFVKARPAETFVGQLIVPGEIKTVLNQRSAGKGVIADAIAAHPRVEKREREKKENQKQALRYTRGARGRCAEVWLVHERVTRRKPFLFPAAIIAGKHGK